MSIRRIAAVAALLTCANASAAALEHAFIAFRDGLPQGIEAELTDKGVPHGLVLPTISSVAVTAPRALLEEYAKDPRVRAVRLQRRLQLHLYSSVPQINARGVEAPETIEQNGQKWERPGVTGAGVTVAVIDSGIFAAHPDIVPRALVGRNFELSTLARQAAGVLPPEVWDLYATATGPLALQDEVGHGTHCAGIIGGDGFSASGLDQRGVAPGVEFVALKIASAGNGVVEDIGFEANAVAAIDHLIRNREALGNPSVASNSWGLLPEEAQGLFGPTNYDPSAEVVRAGVAAGITFVFSAGNDGGGPDSDTVRPIPGGMDEVISVASACKADRGGCAAGGVNSFSSRGPQVDVAAPGDQILSTQSPSILAPLGQALEGDYFGDAPQDQVINRIAYMRLSGTSMAAPHVAGVVALLLEANPALTPQQVRDALVATADDMVVEGDPELKTGFDKASGHGLVNVRKALAYVTRPAEAAPAPKEEGSFGGAWSAGLILMLAVLARRRGGSGC